METQAGNLLFWLQILKWQNYVLILYPVQMVLQFIFIKKMGRKFDLHIIHLSDFTLLVCSILLISWVNQNISNGLDAISGLDQRQFMELLIQNLTNNDFYKFQYIFSF